MSAELSSQADALRAMLEAHRAMQEAGYTQRDVQVLLTSAVEHIEDDSRQPHAFGPCTNSRHVITAMINYTPVCP